MRHLLNWLKKWQIRDVYKRQANMRSTSARVFKLKLGILVARYHVSLGYFLSAWPIKVSESPLWYMYAVS